MIATMSRLLAYGVDIDMPPPDTTLLAFDPGGTTGWFKGAFSADGKIYEDTLSWGQFNGQPHYLDVGYLIEQAINLTGHLMVVTEDYRPDFGRAQNYIALEYIGVMSYVCRKGLVPFERQGRDIKTFWTSDNLRKVGFWPKGMPHAQDAARHWLAYAGKQNPKLARNILRKLR